jgi:chromosomal replication initiator protein
MINVPRFRKNPIDTSVYNWYTIKRKPILNNVDFIRQYVIEFTGIDPLINKQCRKSEYVKARQLFMYFIRKNTSLSQSQVGEIVSKDHASVFHAEQCVQKFMTVEKGYRYIVEEIESKIMKRKTA